MKKLTNRVLSLLTVVALLSNSLSFGAIPITKNATVAVENGEAVIKDALTTKQKAEAKKKRKEVLLAEEKLMTKIDDPSATPEQIEDAANNLNDKAKEAESFVQRLSNKVNPRIAILSVTAATAAALAANYMLYGEAGIVGRGIESGANLLSSAREYVPSWENVKGGVSSAAGTAAQYGKTAASYIIPSVISRKVGSYWYGEQPTVQQMPEMDEKSDVKEQFERSTI
jgi:hypothetical protein